MRWIFLALMFLNAQLSYAEVLHFDICASVPLVEALLTQPTNELVKIPAAKPLMSSVHMTEGNERFLYLKRAKKTEEPLKSLAKHVPVVSPGTDPNQDLFLKAISLIRDDLGLVIKKSITPKCFTVHAGDAVFRYRAAVRAKATSGAGDPPTSNHPEKKLKNDQGSTGPGTGSDRRNSGSLPRQ